jgi:peptidoglycan/xylan/chitin deacetylase (PgdA/CDA1 family)
MKPVIPRRLQILARKWVVQRKRAVCRSVWPIDPGAGALPVHWNGWPGNKQFALVLTHDVEGETGFKRVKTLTTLEERLGFKSSYNFVPKKYNVDRSTIDWLRSRGFEVGVHGWKHDGKLYASREKFERRARKINRCLRDWGATGFRSPAMHHNLDWLHRLEIEYDMSTFDTDPFEPQTDGVATVFPFWVSDPGSDRGYVEIPYTLPQDFTLFVLMGQREITIWEEKLRWIAGIGGMALVNTHPDYMNFGDRRFAADEYPCSSYEDFLNHVSSTYSGRYWNALPQEISAFWRMNRPTSTALSGKQMAL